jgi:putative hydrolase of HD superfamily
MILDFFKTAVNLKNISRQGWINKLSLKHPESVSDHSYSMAIMGMVISDLENYNSEKILKMILLHDLAESKIGDYTPNQISKENKIKIENKAYDEIINALPDAIKLQYGQIW